jgi:hypothetical protein
MNEHVKAAVLAVLRRSDYGFANVSSRGSTSTGLTRWQQFVNWLAKKLRANQKPFTDPLNWRKVEVLPLRQVADPDLIEEAMRELASEPACRICGRKDLLVPDPAGYYCHAERYDGAPLLCRNKTSEHEIVVYP